MNIRIGGRSRDALALAGTRVTPCPASVSIPASGIASVMLATSPAQMTHAQPPTDERVLRAELDAHPLVEAVWETTQWGVAGAKDNSRKIFAMLKLTDSRTGQPVQLQSCASALKERVTKAAVLADLLAKVNAHVRQVEEVRLEHAPQQSVEAASASVAASASDTVQSKRGHNHLSYIIVVAGLRERIARANNRIRALCKNISEIERKFQNELAPLQDMRANLEAELKNLAHELEETTKQSRPGKQQRLDQPVQSSDDAGTGSNAATQQQPWDKWDRREFCRQESIAWSRRQVQLSDSVPMPSHEQRRRGQEGPLDHWRRGLVGAVQDWSEGSREHAAHLVFELISRLGLTDRIRERLGDKVQERSAATDTIIVDRFIEAISILKQCQSEEQRREYLFALALVMPPLAEARDPEGMEKRVTDRLGIRRGCRSAAEGHRLSPLVTY